VVGTLMTNLGFEQALSRADIPMARAKVGDRYVLEALRSKDLSLGGEQSGHIVFADDATTGDGLLTALHVMARVATAGASLAELAAVVQRLPQTLVNVRVTDRDAVAASPVVSAAVSAAELELGDSGRVLLRPSGTEQLIRVMVEAATQQDADAVANRLAGVVAAV
jgi:phosphoglucosamine mutase